MSFPIRCFTCGKVIGNKWEEYEKRVENDEEPQKVLNEMKIGRFCCRRMFITHVDTDKYAQDYPVYPERIQRIITRKYFGENQDGKQKLRTTSNQLFMKDGLVKNQN